MRFSYVTIETVIFSRVKITCYLHVWRYVFARKLTWYFIGVYIINANIFHIHCNLFLLFLSSVPHYQAEYWYFENGLLPIACFCFPVKEAKTSFNTFNKLYYLKGLNTPNCFTYFIFGSSKIRTLNTWFYLPNAIMTDNKLWSCLHVN